MNLSAQKCVPCEGGMLPLTRAEAEKYLAEISNSDALVGASWQLSADSKQTSREFKFKDFKAAMEFVNQVAALAEQEGHHPDILIHNWNQVQLTLATHAIGGLSENDFILAAKINCFGQP